MSTLKVDTVRPVTTDGSLSLKGDSGGSATTNGISVDSSGNTSITGTATIATVDINGGTVDGTTIGASSAAAGSFTDMAFNSGYGSVATAYGCRAWVNFRGTSQSGTLNSSGPTSGQYTATVTSATTFTIQYSSTTYTVTTIGNHEIGDGEGVDLAISVTIVTIDTQIRASGNVSSITDRGTGQYTVNFATAMPDANYAVMGSLKETSAGNPSDFYAGEAGSGLPSTTSFSIASLAPGVGYADASFIHVSVFR